MADAEQGPARNAKLGRIGGKNITQFQASSQLAKCDEGYICDVCGKDVEGMLDSDLYLRYVIGRIDPEKLHDQPERHIRCNPVLAQFIRDNDFPPVTVDGDFDRRTMDRSYVKEQTVLVTRGWRRLREVAGLDLPIMDYPLPEARIKWSE